MTGFRCAALTNRGPSDQSKETSQSHGRQDRHSGLVNDRDARRRGASLIGSRRRSWAQHVIGRSRHEPRGRNCRAAVVRLIVDRDGSRLRAQAEGSEEQEQAAPQEQPSPRPLTEYEPRAAPSGGTALISAACFIAGKADPGEARSRRPARRSHFGCPRKSCGSHLACAGRASPGPGEAQEGFAQL